MSKTIRATGKLHEWSEDDLNPAGENALVEGAEAGSDTSKPIVERSNFCQIMGKVAEVTGTFEKVDKYGRDSEMAYQLELRYGELANDQEWAVVGTTQAGAGQATEGDAPMYIPNPPARKMADFVTQLDASVIVDGSAATDVEGVEEALLAAHLATYMEGGNPSYLVTDPKTAGIVSAMAMAAEAVTVTSVTSARS